MEDIQRQRAEKDLNELKRLIQDHFDQVSFILFFNAFLLIHQFIIFENKISNEHKEKLNFVREIVFFQSHDVPDQKITIVLCSGYSIIPKFKNSEA